MTLTLPGWLVEAMRYLGQEFPQSSEDGLWAWADQLRDLHSVFGQTHEGLAAAITNLVLRGDVDPDEARSAGIHRDL